ASAAAIGPLAEGYGVHLTTEDPAAHAAYTFEGRGVKENLAISSISPEIEVEKYQQDVLATAGEGLDEEGLAYLKEDLESPWTEEMALFRAFADVVEKSENEIVVIDTAPTGHTLLLLDS